MAEFIAKVILYIFGTLAFGFVFNVKGSSDEFWFEAWLAGLCVFMYPLLSLIIP